jgi:hypothetical protein
MNDPTALQTRGDVHETPFKELHEEVFGTGSARFDHREPFQRSANATMVVMRCTRTETDPTAMQSRPEVQNTSLNVPPALWSGCIDHREPFQRSVRSSVRGGTYLLTRYSLDPTARHAVAEVHDTLLRELPFAPARFGVPSIAHREPFQRSASVLGAWLPKLSTTIKDPTAVHRLTDEQEIPVRELESAPNRAGVD